MAQIRQRAPHQMAWLWMLVICSASPLSAYHVETWFEPVDDAPLLVKQSVRDDPTAAAGLLWDDVLPMLLVEIAEDRSSRDDPELAVLLLRLEAVDGPVLLTACSQPVRVGQVLIQGGMLRGQDLADLVDLQFDEREKSGAGLRHRRDGPELPRSGECVLTLVLADPAHATLDWDLIVRRNCGIGQARTAFELAADPGSGGDRYGAIRGLRQSPRSPGGPGSPGIRGSRRFPARTPAPLPPRVTTEFPPDGDDVPYDEVPVFQWSCDPDMRPAGFTLQIISDEDASSFEDPLISVQAPWDQRQVALEHGDGERHYYRWRVLARTAAGEIVLSNEATFSGFPGESAADTWEVHHVEAGPITTSFPPSGGDVSADVWPVFQWTCAETITVTGFELAFYQVGSTAADPSQPPGERPWMPFLKVVVPDGDQWSVVLDYGFPEGVPLLWQVLGFTPEGDVVESNTSTFSNGGLESRVESQAMEPGKVRLNLRRMKLYVPGGAKRGSYESEIDIITIDGD